MLRAEMFGMGMGEILVILVIALLFLGPDKLPDAAKAISKTIRDLRKQTRELQSSLEGDNELGSAIREIKGALRGEDLRMRPPRPASMAPNEVFKDLDPAAQLAAGTAAAAVDSTSADGVDIGADDHLPEAHEAEPYQEPTTADSAVSPAPDPDLPTIRPAQGAVAKGSTDRGAADATASKEDTQGHG